MLKHRRLWDTYRFPSFRANSTVQGIFGDPKARVICLHRRGKNGLRSLWLLRASLVRPQAALEVRDLACGDHRIYLEIESRRVDCKRCGKVKREKLDWLADNPFYSKRFAFFVGRRCRVSTIQDVAQETHLDWRMVKDLERQYMREQLREKRGPRLPR